MLSISALVEIDVIGVFNSCPASVIKRFCRSIFFINGLIALFEKSIIRTKTNARAIMPMIIDVHIRLDIYALSFAIFKNKTVTPVEVCVIR